VASVTFLWHLHQPSYRTRDGVAHAPWVAIHAGGGYYTLLKAISDTNARGQVVNVVPTLVEQLEAYRDDRVDDPVIAALVCPASQLDQEQRRLLIEWCPNTPPRQLERYPRLRQLIERAQGVQPQDRLDAAFGVGDLRDIQVLFVLAHAGAQGASDPVLAPLAEQGHHFTSQHHRQIAAWLQEQPAAMLDLLTQVAQMPGVEIATSPYAHPIIPLLIDTNVAIESCSPGPAPNLAPFKHPGDGATQIDVGLRFMRERGFNPVGCWPPEGSVSAAALELYRDAKVRWLVTDEGILERSLGRAIRTPDGCSPELYTPWQLQGNPPTLFFRDRWLSDRIGFTYGRWDDERAAARNMLDHLEGIARTLPESASIVIALDGENPWPHYFHGGGEFLEELFRGLDAVGPLLRPATFAELASDVPTQTLETLHPGSWIGSVFATWIGHPEKTRAWDLLSRVRSTLGSIEGDVLESTLLAEGSDWFWWLGDDNPTDLAPLYDRIFRHHLRDACELAGATPPKDLAKSLKSPTRHVSVPVTNHWLPPTLNGRVDSYFEWAISSWVEPTVPHPVRRLGLWSNPNQLFVVIEGAEPLESLLEDHQLVVRLIAQDGEALEVRIHEDTPAESQAGSCGLGRVAEICLRWQAGVGFRLQVLFDGRAIPDGATMVLIPDLVDELAPAEPRDREATRV
jgi:alpha-amylase/alpha-mannosidase (GH57 family)